MAGKSEDEQAVVSYIYMTSALRVLPCVDSAQMAAARRRELDIPREEAQRLGRSALEAIEAGRYLTGSGKVVAWADAVQAARSAKRSISPEEPLPASTREPFPQTTLQVTNETTLRAALRLAQRAVKVVALNFANGVQPGGGFLHGARAQEETLCRSSALYATLEGDRMYEEHRQRPTPDSTNWAVYSPDVPVFRRDEGTELDRPWLLSFITCAAPVARAIGQPLAGDLLRERIHRVLEIAKSFGYDAMILGAWGCGAFGNDPHRTAMDFRVALENEFTGAFAEIVFAITDWSPERRTLGPFRDVLANPS